MNKLGFAIKLASNGVLMPVVCNKDQWTNKVVDIRDFLKLFNGLAYIEQGHQVSTGNSSTFISFDEEGCFLVLFKALSGRFGDFLSGWIYIPNTIEATGDDIMNTYNYVRNILSQSNLNDSIEDIEAFFSKEYPQKEFAAQYVPSSGEEFGVRFVDMYYSMKEILDADRYQPYYSKFKAVFLLDKNSEVKIAKEQVVRFKDLTKITIEKTCIFKAPSPEEVRILGRGAKILFSTNQEFKSPVLAKKGDKIQLYAHREGFEPVTLPIVTIQEDGQKYSINPNTVKWMKRISPSMFLVYNSKHEKLDKGVQIFINGTDITYNDALISEEDCRQAKVKIIAPDYETFEQKRNLLAEDYNITLSRKVKSYKATVELANGKLAELTLESKYLSSKYESPLKGYVFGDYQGRKVLRMSSWFVWKQRLWGFFVVLVFNMLIAVCTAFDSWLESHHFKWGLPPWEENTPAQQDTLSDSTKVDDDTHSQAENQSESEQYNAAIKYLDKNPTWHKDSLDKYDATRGLFEELNEFKKEEIIRRTEKLGNVQRLADIVSAFKNTVAYDCHIGKEDNNGNYNSLEDKKISVVNYIEWISKQHSEVVKKSPLVSEPKKSKITGINTAPTQPAVTGSSKPKRGGV